MSSYKGCHIIVTPSGYATLQHIQELLGVKMRYLMVSKKKDPFLRENGIENVSFVITVCHRLASLQMSNSDPQDKYFYPTSHSW